MHATWVLILVFSLTFELIKQVRLADQQPRLPSAEIINVHHKHHLHCFWSITELPMCARGKHFMNQAAPLCTHADSPFKTDSFHLHKSSSEISGGCLTTDRCLWNETEWKRRYSLKLLCSFYINISQHNFFYKDLELQINSFLISIPRNLVVWDRDSSQVRPVC